MDRQDQNSTRERYSRNYTNPTGEDRNQMSDTRGLSDLMEFDFDDIFMENTQEEPVVKKVTPSKSKTKRNRKKGKKWYFGYLDWIKEAILILLVLWVTVSFIGSISKIEDDSMSPGLKEEQWIVTSKVIYRFKSPARGDVVLYTVNGEEHIGRIVGMPEDRVEIRQDGSIYINDTRYLDGNTKFIANTVTYPVQVEPDSYFILCDNSVRGEDSRYKSIGTVGRDQIIGKVSARMWPLKEIGVVK